MFFLMHYVVKYRKEVILTNLRNSFPEKTEEERKKIAKQYVRHMCDLFIESFKGLSMSKRTLRKRVKVIDMSPSHYFLDKKQPVIFVLGHFGNWEWTTPRYELERGFDINAIYHPLSNKVFDRLMIKIRTRFGTHVTPMKDAIRATIKGKETLTCTALIADQSPDPKTAYWLTFLNQETPVFTGPGKLSAKLKLPIIYSSLRKVKRGHYELTLKTIVEDPSNMTEGEILEVFFQHLEEDIKNQPFNWLWSHRRWKHKRKKTSTPKD